MPNKPISEEPMAQVKSAAQKQGFAPMPSRGPGRPPKTVETAKTTANLPRPSDDDVPEAETALQPNVNNPSGKTYSPRPDPNLVPFADQPAYPEPNQGLTTTENWIKNSPDDNTGPKVNPAQPDRTYTQAEVDSILSTARAQGNTAALFNKNAAPVIEEAIPSADGMVVVKPIKTIEPFIGDRKFYLVRDKPVRVSRTVAKELSRAGLIYNLYDY